MIFINEWLPNPVGSDTQNEWIELWNSGVRYADGRRFGETAGVDNDERQTGNNQADWHEAHYGVSASCHPVFE